MLRKFYLKRASHISLLALIIVLSVGPGISAQVSAGVLSPAEIAQRSFPSVVTIVVKNAIDGSEQTGSGFFVTKDTIATTFRLIENASQGKVRVAGREEEYRILGTVGVDPLHDVALVRIQFPGSQPLVLANSAASVGDDVFTVRLPKVPEGMLSTGKITGIERLKDIDLFQITASVTPDSSGGPVLNTRAEVVGVAVSYQKEGRSLNFAVPIEHLSNLIAKTEPLTALGSPKSAPPTTTEPSKTPVRPVTSDEAIIDAARSVTEFEVNGLKVILKRRAKSPTIAGGLFVRGGARNINDKDAGIEYMTLSAAVEAGKNLPRQTVRRELASMGSAIGAASNNDYSVVSFGTTRENLDRFWNILSEVTLSPAFADADVNRIREQILTGLRERGTLPESALETLQDRTLYTGHPYANDVLGTVATISAITPADIRAYHKNIMETSRLVFVVVGDIEPDVLKTKIESTFGKLPRGSYKETPYPPLDFSKGTLDTAQRTLPTNYVKGTFAAPAPGTKDYFAMRVAVSILQTLVYQTVRQQLQLSYAPDAAMNNFAVNTANISVSTTDPNRAIAEMRKQIRLLQENTLNPEVIDEISAFFLTRHYIGQETSGAQVGELAQYELVGGGWRNAFEFMNGVRAVTPQDVRDVANRYMKNLRFAYIGNTASIERTVFVQ